VRIRWTRRALARLREIDRYVSVHNPDAARRLAGRIELLVRHLEDHPLAGRIGRVAGTRELILPEYPYIIAYRVTLETVEILTVMHAARRWPETF
jgi:toxin ParE1/3/4